ncbi:acyl-CoA dehydrogenase [Bacteriovorax stolpii]|uniref:Acyl-CoA dehydrogenase n=1 Tax=Bacteriovorax stolpii TaxID=960 RepID=A0A2K9NR12_BACTC|nr:acyl-CoA dehydrogenase family protein [Bacteriovorax stolpii]AUN97970.1 acyl-CoA dehydrogenase [Bacteriovorax stolpii]QDK42044.1 acyl-CoA dehydrogenase [Bacteriovorax stolpii]TDP51803.1 acyl-CoA dehydrogenase family protein 9 [Bacteriovorax stolpii]
MASNSNGQLESVVGSLFFGEINENLVFPFPHFSDSQVEMAKEMTAAVDAFAKDNINGEKFDKEAHLPKEVIQGLAEMGLLGLGVPEDLGGLGLDYSLYCRVFAQVASHDGSVATMIGAHQSIGYRALLNEGTPEQKKKWLPRLASGEVIAAFCLTEPGSGSDAYSIKTKAVDNKDGTYTITGQKLWITNGGLAGFYSVFCKTEHVVDGKTVEKISCFIVEGGSPGLSFGEKENKMGIRASETRAVYFDKVVVPKENILGELGKGFKIAMNVLNSGRLSLGAGCVSGMKMILEMATAHATNRKQFDRPIAEFGLIQDKLTKMAAMTYAAESMVYLTTGNMIKGMNDYYMETAVCKIYGSESLWASIDMAMQIAAGNGYMKEYPYERLMRDVRINMIFEGTNEILRALLALSGVRGPSEEMKELGKVTDVSKALQDPIKSLGVFTKFARKRMSHMMGSKALTKAHPELKEQAEKFSSMLGRFAIAVEDTLIKYGKNIIDNELPQGRLADMVIDLYIILACISRTTAILNSSKATQEQKDYVLRLTKYICNESGRKIKRNLKAMSKNNDKNVIKISETVVKNGGYGFDIIDF